MASKRKMTIDRRDFLKTSSVVGASLALGASSCGSGGTKEEAPTASRSAPSEAGTPSTQPATKPEAAGETPKVDGAPAIVPADASVEQVNVALIGCGVQGNVLMESIRKGCPGVNFKAVCDISPWNLTQMRNLLSKVYHQDVMDHSYVDYRELLSREKELHAVVIATPDWMHAEHSIACMKAGLHVYCEKEMSNDLAKAREMVMTAWQSGKLLQIGHQRRSSERYRFAFDKILSEGKLLGIITHAYAQWNRSTAASAPVLPSPRAQPSMEVLEKYGYGSLREFACWRWFRKFGGGPICDLGSHQIDVFGWFLGRTPTKVIVDGGRDYWQKHGDSGYEWYDNVRAIYHFPLDQGLVRAQYQVLTTTGSMGYFETFMGTDGTLSLSENPSRCRIYAEGHLQPDKKVGVHPWDKWSQKGYVTRLDEPPKEDSTLAAGGMADLLKLYKASPPPVQYLMNVLDNATYHGPHLRNFFNAIRGKEKLNCPGEVGYECAVQVLKVNQLLDAGKDSGTFEEGEFTAAP